MCRSKSRLDGRRLDPSPFVSFKAPPVDWSSLDVMMMDDGRRDGLGL
jgi:hypothetical protein